MPLLRSGFRKVVFSIIIMAIVLFYSRGLMGDKEISFEGIAGFLKDPFGLVRRKKKKAEGVRADG